MKRACNILKSVLLMMLCAAMMLTTVVAVDSAPVAPVAPAEPTAPATSVESVNVLIIGGSAYVQSRNADDLVAQMLKTDGGIKDVNVDFIKVNGERGRLDQLFAWSGTEITGPNSNATRAETVKEIESALAAGAALKYDYVFAATSVDWSLLPYSKSYPYTDREVSCFKYLEELTYKHNPNAVLAIVSTQGWQNTKGADKPVILVDGDKTFTIAENYIAQTAAIAVQAKKVEAALNESSTPLNVKVVNYGDVFVKAFEKGIQVLSTGYSGKFGDNSYYYGHNDSSAYIFAAVTYNAITGKNPYELTVKEWKFVDREGVLTPANKITDAQRDELTAIVGEALGFTKPADPTTPTTPTEPTTPTTPTDPTTPTTPTEPEVPEEPEVPTRPVVDVKPYTGSGISEASTIEGKSVVNILTVGGSAINGSYRDGHIALADMLSDSFKGAIAVDNITIAGEHGRMDQLFSWKKTEMTGISTTAARKNELESLTKALAPDAAVKYDYVMITVGRDWNLVAGQPYSEREAKAFAYIEEILYKHNPNAVLIIGAANGYVNTKGADQEIILVDGSDFFVASDTADHVFAIENQAQYVKAQLDKNDVPVTTVVAKYGAAALKAMESGVDFVTTAYARTWGENQYYYFPEAATGYIIANMNYSIITGNNPLDTDITVWGSREISKETESIIQKNVLEVLDVKKGDTPWMPIKVLAAVNETATAVELAGTMAVNDGYGLELTDISSGSTLAEYANSKLLKDMLQADSFDIVVLEIGRDDELYDAETMEAEKKAFLEIEALVKAGNPDAKLVIVAPFAYNNEYGIDFIIQAEYSNISTKEEYNALIKKNAEALSGALTLENMTVNCGDLFTAAEAEEIDVFESHVSNKPNEYGIELIAKAIFEAIF